MWGWIMQGTNLKNLKLTKVVDGDTVKVFINDKEESLRLACLDTEESHNTSNKPVTNAGKLASEMAKKFFDVDEEGIPQNDIRVDIEFDTSDPLPYCLKKHRGNFGRLICYIYRNGESYNIHAVQNGYSPYFVKYGRSRLYHQQFIRAEKLAQSKNYIIWNPEINEGGNSRDYDQLIPWWNFRESIVQDYRQFGLQIGVLSVRLNYDVIVEAADTNSDAVILGDLQNGISKEYQSGYKIFAGSKYHKFNLWIPKTSNNNIDDIVHLIETRYSNYGRGYVYVSGKVNRYPTEEGIPQIVVTNTDQLSCSVRTITRNS